MAREWSTALVERLLLPWRPAPVDATTSRRGTAARLGRRLLRDFALCSLLVALLLPPLLVWRGTDDWLWPLTISVWLSLPIGMVVAEEAFDALERWLLRRGRIATRLPPGARLLGLFLGLAGGGAVGYLLPLPFMAAPGLDLLVRDYARNLAFATIVVGLLLVAAALLWYRAEAFRLKSAVAVANLHVLKEQMQPHFLFNALSSLKELIVEDPGSAAEVTQQIADMYRLILESSRARTAPLGAELAIVRNYLAVQRVRFGERLRAHIEAPDELLAAHVPSLVLQTLVENAIKHGVCKAREGGEIRVSAARTDDGNLEIEVSNTGAPFHPVAHDAPRGRTPVGLANTAARLELLYGPGSRLSVESDPLLGTRVRFRVTGHPIAGDDAGALAGDPA